MRDMIGREEPEALTKERHETTLNERPPLSSWDLAAAPHKSTRASVNVGGRMPDVSQQQQRMR